MTGTAKFKYGALLTVVLLLGSMPGMATLDSGNEPLNGFSEGSDVFEIYHANGNHDTVFAMNETMYIRAMSSRIPQLGTSGNANRVRVLDPLGNVVYTNSSAFVQVSNSPPYTYTAQVELTQAAGFVPGDYILELQLRSGTGGAPVMYFSDMFRISGGTPQDVRLYTDGFTTEGYSFGSNAIIYIRAWSTGVPNLTNSDLSVVMYDGTADVIPLSQLSNSSVGFASNYTHISYSLAADLDTGKITVTNGYWYTMIVHLRDGTGALLSQGAVQFEINFTLNNPPSVYQGATTCSPTEVMAGAGSTTFQTTFYHPDQLNPNMFTVTYRVRDETGNEYTILNAKHNGEAGLSIVHIGGGEYNVTYTWSVPETQPLGRYDLYFRVFDGYHAAEDLFDANIDELTIVKKPGVPVIPGGSTTVMPQQVTAQGPDTVKIMVNFTHEDGLPADAFRVTFKVRDPGNNIITLVDGNNTTAGLEVVQTSAASYTASYSWNPPDNQTLGTYDLYSRVEDLNGYSAEDQFYENLEELLIMKRAAVPVVVPGSTYAGPASVNKTGNETTTLMASFTHEDRPSPDTFRVTFKVRDQLGAVHTVVENASIRDTRGLSISLESNSSYAVSYIWDPPLDLLTGPYDLCFSVRDANGKEAVDLFENNLKELMITKLPGLPVIKLGATTAVPSVVNVNGTSTVELIVNFTHEDLPTPDVFTVSFMIRDAGNVVTTLVENGIPGTGNLTVELSNGTYSARFLWDPPTSMPLGPYDLSAEVKDPFGHVVRDVFDNNRDELTLTKGPVNQAATITGVVKDSVSGKGIANASVTVFLTGTNTAVEELRTDAQGRFTVALSPGTYDIEAAADNYGAKRVIYISAVAGKSTDVEILLTEETTTEPGTTPVDWVFPMFVLLIVVIILLSLLLVYVIWSHRKAGDEGPTSREEEPEPVPPEEVDVEPLEREGEEEKEEDAE